ncbi:MAG: hypothetical protein HFH41_08960 [Lachnospiraceae bacterium]|nr:hypothetical protein [Lachnospiraceae bacterium]
MIDRINNQKYYNHSKINQQKRETTESPEFNLNLGKEGVIYEKNSQKKTAKTQETQMETEEQTSGGGKSTGVKLEISSKGYEKAVRERRKSSFMEEVRKYAGLAVDFLKAVWDKIWNDHTGEKEMEFPEVLEGQIAEQEGSTEETGLMVRTEGKSTSDQIFFDENLKFPERKLSNQIAESIYTQEEIRQLFRRGNQKEIEDFLSHHGEKHLAKSTELLTQYDKRGSLVGINDSDRDLILHGNRNQMKL